MSNESKSETVIDMEKLNDIFKCPICLNVMKESHIMLETPYGHVFCKNCILECLKQKESCPITRRPLYKKDLKKPSIVLKQAVGFLYGETSDMEVEEDTQESNPQVTEFARKKIIKHISRISLILILFSLPIFFIFALSDIIPSTYFLIYGIIVVPLFTVCCITCLLTHKIIDFDIYMNSVEE